MVTLSEQLISTLFGAVAYAKTPDEKRFKLDPKAKPAVFVGYSTSQYGYLLLNNETKKLFTARDVFIDDKHMFFDRSRVTARQDVEVENTGSTQLDDWEPTTPESIPSLSGEKAEECVPSLSRENAEESTQEVSLPTHESSKSPDIVPKNDNKVWRVFSSAESDDQPSMRYRIGAEEERNRFYARCAEEKKKQEEADWARDAGLRRSSRVQTPTPKGLASAAQEQKRNRAVNVFQMENLDTKYREDDVSRETQSDPKTEEEALVSPQADLWKEAMLTEFLSLQAKETWIEVPRRDGMKIVKTKWVFRRKLHLDGRLDKFKARFVAKGFTQTPGVDVNDTYASIMRHTTWRVLTVFALEKNYNLVHWDIKTAFLNADLKEEIYIETPKYFYGYRRDVVLRLKKGLYGLQQAPREWQMALHGLLQDNGLIQSRSDKSMYYLKERNGEITAAIGIWVDDMIVAVHPNKMKEVRGMISRKYDLDDRGQISEFLGVHFHKTKTSWIISQSTYTNQILDRFSMSNCNPYPTPMAKGLKLSKDHSPQTEEQRKAMAKVPYQSAVGALMYLAMCTRPDILYAVVTAARFMHDPGEVHWAAVKRILRYLKGTTNYGIHYQKTQFKGVVRLQGYSDASWGSDDVDTYKSNTGFVMLLSQKPVSWKSVKQTLTAQSSTEAEYMAACAACKEVLWLRQLLSELNVCEKAPTVLYEDNQAVIKVGNGEGHYEASKHFIIRYFALEDNIKLGHLVLVHQPGEYMTADILTKALERQLFERHRNKLLTEQRVEPG